MITVKSQSDPKKIYCIESRSIPVTTQEFKMGFGNIRGTLESTLELDPKQVPIDSESYDVLKGIIKDCAHPELRAAYDDRYASFIIFLRAMGEVQGNSYRIHTVRI